MGGKTMAFILAFETICLKKYTEMNTFLNFILQIADFVLFFQMLLRCLHEILRICVIFQLGE